MSDLPLIIPDGAAFAKRSAPERPAAEGERRQSSAGFDAILGGFAPEKPSTSLPGPEESGRGSDHDPEKVAVAPAYPGGDTPEADRLLRALFDDARPERTGEPKVMERADPDPSRLVEQAVPVIEVDIAGDQSALAPAIAHHLAAMLDGAEPAPPETATAMGPRGQGRTSEPWLVASRISGPEVAAADRGRFDQSGRLEPAIFRVTRHETHFRPAFLS